MRDLKAWIKTGIKFIAAIGVAWALPIWSQPTPPTAGDYLCQATPGALTVNDTLPEVFDDSGFTTIFDGTTWKGWWHDCQSGHTSDRVNGAIWRLSASEKAMFSTQRGNNGGLMLTKKKYANYEARFDIWPTYGDDGGFFNRVEAGGACYQTVLDYIQGGAFGGSWGEGGWGNMDLRPFSFSGSDSNLSIPGGGNGGNWTEWTAKMKPTTFGCNSTGCNESDWRKLWNLYGWNEVRIKFYGGLTNTDPIVHMESFMHRDPGLPWVPLWTDSQNHKTDSNYMGFQVHGNGRFQSATNNGNGNWYRNIKMRYLNNKGQPIVGRTGPLVPPPGTSNILQWANADQYHVKIVGSDLLANFKDNFQLQISDLSGRIIKQISGKAGPLQIHIGKVKSAILLVDIKSGNKVAHLELNTPLK